MSQVLRYTPSLKPGLMIEDAEGKWAKYEVLAQVVAQVGALQALMTAADERADVLVDLLTHAHIAIHTMEPGFFLLEKIDAALNPAEGGGDEA